MLHQRGARTIFDAAGTNRLAPILFRDGGRHRISFPALSLHQSRPNPPKVVAFLLPRFLFYALARLCKSKFCFSRRRSELLGRSGGNARLLGSHGLSLNAVMSKWSDEETNDPQIADALIEKWTEDGNEIEHMQQSRREIFTAMIKHRPRIRLTIRQRTRVLD